MAFMDAAGIRVVVTAAADARDVQRVFGLFDIAANLTFEDAA